MKNSIFKTLIISTLLFTASNALANTSSGGSTFALGEKIKFNPDPVEHPLDQNLLDLSNTSSGGETFKIRQAALDVSEGEEFIVEQILKTYRPELTHYFSQVRALVEDDSASTSKMKSPIHESLRATVLKNYGGYDEEEAIEIVIKAPLEAQNELRQILYSL